MHLRCVREPVRRRASARTRGQPARTELRTRVPRVNSARVCDACAYTRACTPRGDRCIPRTHLHLDTRDPSALFSRRPARLARFYNQALRPYCSVLEDRLAWVIEPPEATKPPFPGGTAWQLRSILVARVPDRLHSSPRFHRTQSLGTRISRSSLAVPTNSRVQSSSKRNGRRESVLSLRPRVQEALG